MARNTKASRILNDSAMRLEAARMRVDLAQSQLNTAKATRDVLQEAHNALERELTAKPRKKAAPAPAQAPLPTDKDENDQVGPKCGVCGHPEDYMDHTGPSPTKHDFEAPKTKKAAAQK